MNAQHIKATAVLAAAAVLASGSMVSAQPWKKQPAPDAGQRQRQEQSQGRDRFDEVIKELGLTPAQQQKLAQQRKDERAQADQLRQQMRDVQQSLAEELDKDRPDRKKVRALIREMKNTYGARIENKVDGILAMKSILTPEQVRILNERTKAFERKRGGTYEKESHHRFDRRGFGRRLDRSGFCQRLG